MPPYKTPGVYVEETSGFPMSVAEVATAVPAFIGYTETAARDGVARRNTPVRIDSMAGFEAVFGGPQRPRFRVTTADPAGADVVVGPQGYRLIPVGPVVRLHDAMRLFFANGGGASWVVSVGGYDAPGVEAAALARGLAALEAEREPTLVVIPEAVALAAADCYALQTAMLAHCAAANRFAILDIRGGDQPRDASAGDPVAAFRGAIGTEHVGYGAAYYPWLLTAGLTDLTAADFAADEGVDVLALLPRLTSAPAARATLMPPAAAIAGIYTAVDNARGVWKAPANVSVNGVTAPAVAIDARDQEDLNVSPTGRSVNAIRAFVGEGVLVWGARTLDGNSLDWRYINVRRTLQMVEETLRLAMQALVIEPNAAATWAVARGMVENYLTGLWRRGGLVGVKAEDAFAVLCGLGQTMTQADVDGGVLRVTVLMAMSRPAEFIELTFEQKMQAA